MNEQTIINKQILYLHMNDKDPYDTTYDVHMHDATDLVKDMKFLI